ncbi:HAD-IA family hydrolase [Paracoccus sp. 1_MG-2023]|uniref:HAD-IA family hydrolase n=1 Tax=unclassified Paracoccus (in: a-proteobacteria) TaxID=2688777 RepID=UPI001C085946|nr:MULTISPECIES: HAD-IA family hydrolase [unclassified Paracoccus (in: a-proteobacteria)]MBU2958236.1 HAD-IA family hydrolase [Paracoccus sp. C2R09]MDO6668363.1 HAD-IA family hydrolase [Paracoccus sp. 1_MG-2023]
MAGTVVFDLDGTLADTSGDLIAAANACFRGRGMGDLLHPVDDALVAFHGGRAMLRAGYARAPRDVLIPPEAEDQDFHRLLDHYGEAIDVHTRLYPGVEPALDRLAQDGHILSVCTNKPSGLAEVLLRKLGIRDRFASMIGADTLPVRKPDPRPYQAAVEQAGGTVARSFLIGDTETDRKTAAAAGVRVALVSFGPEGEAIRRLAPDAMLDHFDALPDLARDWLA